MSRESGIPPDSHAILIGVSHYQNDDVYPSYPAIANSLHGMLEVLTDPTLCGWPEDRVELIADPTNSGLLITRVRRLARKTSGVLLFYFAGHGVLAENSELCLAITDTDPDNPDTTGIEYSKIKNMLYSGTPAATTIVILDSCYSGRAIGLGATNDQLADKTAVEGTYTLTAADATAHVVPLAQQTGVCTSFTGELLCLIRSGIPNGPPELTLNTLYPLLRQRLERKNLPRPNQRGTDTATNFIFTRNAAAEAAMRVAAVRARRDAQENAAGTAASQAAPHLPLPCPPVAESTDTPPRGADRRGRIVAAVGVGSLVLLGVVAVVASQRGSGPDQGGEVKPGQVVSSPAQTTHSTVQARPARLLTTIPTGQPPVAVAISPDGRRAYVSLDGPADLSGGTVAVIDTTRGRVIDQITVNKDPRDVAISRDGRRVYVIGGNTDPQAADTISVIDTTSDTMITTILLSPKSASDGFIAGPSGIALSPDGRQAYVSDDGLLVVDLTRNSVSARIADVSGAVALTPDGGHAYVTCGDIRVIDTTRGIISSRIAVGKAPAGVAVSPDGRLAYVTNSHHGINSVSVIDVGKGTVVGEIGVGESPVGVAFSHDGSHAYVANPGELDSNGQPMGPGNSVSVIDVATNIPIATVPVPNAPTSLAVTPDDRYVYVTTPGTDSAPATTVAVIDTGIGR